MRKGVSLPIPGIACPILPNKCDTRCNKAGGFNIHFYLFLRSHPSRRKYAHMAFINGGGVPITGIVPPILPTDDSRCPNGRVYLVHLYFY